MDAVLQFEALRVDFPGRRGGGALRVLDGLDLDVRPGEMTALVGESGSGKTTAALAAMRLLPFEARTTGAVRFRGANLLACTEREMCAIRGQIGMVFQNPVAALNPTRHVGGLVAEGVRLHDECDAATAWARAVELLAEVGIPDPARRAHDLPHQFSGGQCQRVLIAAALACRPAVLIADEPTSGLDPLVARQILALLARLQREAGLGVLFVTHNLSIAERHAERVTVLRAGRVVETGPAVRFFAAPSHPYSRALLDAVPRLGEAAPRSRPLVETPHLLLDRVGVRYGRTVALADVSLGVRRGECVGIVGESGSGKTSLGRAILQMVPHDGRILLHGVPLGDGSSQAKRAARRRIQPVFQDPRASLHPRLSVGETLGEPLLLAGLRDRTHRAAAVALLLERVGLAPALADRFPRQISGGQAQRVAIARTLAAQPEIIVLDEPTSALDVSTQMRLLLLLRDLAREDGVTLVMISHDIGAVGFLCDRIAVLRSGRMVALAETARMTERPDHPYVAELIETAPRMRGFA